MTGNFSIIIGPPAAKKTTLAAALVQTGRLDFLIDNDWYIEAVHSWKFKRSGHWLDNFAQYKDLCFVNNRATEEYCHASGKDGVATFSFADFQYIRDYIDYVDVDSVILLWYPLSEFKFRMNLNVAKDCSENRYSEAFDNDAVELWRWLNNVKFWEDKHSDVKEILLEAGLPVLTIDMRHIIKSGDFEALAKEMRIFRDEQLWGVSNHGRWLISGRRMFDD